MFTAILDNDQIKVVNYSWGSCEGNVGSFAQERDGHGLLSSRRSRREHLRSLQVTAAPTAAETEPSRRTIRLSNPNVVAVGGTTLVNSGGTFETAWSGQRRRHQHALRSAFVPAGLRAQYTMRSIPDVAFNADPNSGEAAWEYDDSDGSQSAKVSELGCPRRNDHRGSAVVRLPGTLVNAARASKGLSPLGYLNPLIYSISTARSTP